MKRPDTNAPPDTRLRFKPDFRISATDFGPIKSGAVDLRPLTVFVGPSNTGKTYFAILIYALHRILRGFPRLPFLYHFLYPFFDQGRGLAGLPARADELQEGELDAVFKKLSAEGRQFNFSDLPASVRGKAQQTLTDSNMLGAALKTELERCFDLDAVPDLVRLPARANMKVSLAASEEDRDLWRFHMEISKSDIMTGGRIEDITILPAGWVAEAPNRQQRLIEAILNSQRSRYPFELEEFVYAIDAHERSETHYLPAARSGIMQSHRVIASSLVERSTRAGLVSFPELPTFSGVMADFMQRLILYEENRRGDESMRDLAGALERKPLAGQIQTKRPHAGGYPEFVYRPQETSQDIRLSRASSMVSELAPVVLFLRGAISCGDMLIIEEPEAHLHPDAQTQMAEILARLVRAGVRVVVTTHSDWLLMEIGNLMREGELGEMTSNTVGEGSPPSSLRPNEVGVWLFREDESSAGSTVEEIPFDRSEGIEPKDYEDVAEALYNRSATLQNRFEEIAGAAEREQE